MNDSTFCTIQNFLLNLEFDVLERHNNSIIFQTTSPAKESKEVMTDVPLDPEERSQTRTLIRHDHFDEEGYARTPSGRIVERERYGLAAEDPIGKHGIGVSEDGSESQAPSRATDAASFNRDSGYSDATLGSRNFTPGQHHFMINFSGLL